MDVNSLTVYSEAVTSPEVLKHCSPRIALQTLLYGKK
jgi:hypothetical protein